jgi:seryl-tRNA synthetase
MRWGFEPILTPDIARDTIVQGCGFRPRDSEKSPIYSIQNSDASLVGTAEVALAGLYANQILAAEQMPLFMAGFSHAFRREIGSGGRHSRGLYRMHQFSKVELFALSKTLQESAKTLQKMTDFQMSVLRDLNLPFRMLEMPTQELGLSARRKVDFEVWMPSRQGYGEVSSASDCGDFQSRRLNIRFRSTETNANQFVTTQNATALAVPRILISILENHYDPIENCVRMPDVLKPLMGDRI